MLSNKSVDPYFRWRGGEVTRVEAFSDAVFAFAITLLVVSLEVPKTFTQLLDTMRGFLAFGTCFAMIIMLWYFHYKFFRRFALQDLYTIVLNAILLFVVLFYVYPLKFVFTLVVNMFLGVEFTVWPIERDQGAQMMLVYNAGYIAVFGLFGLLYRHAYRLRGELQFTELETMVVKHDIYAFFINIGMGLFSSTIILILGSEGAGIAGFSYWLIGPAMAIHGTINGKRQKRLYEKLKTEGKL